MAATIDYKKCNSCGRCYQYCPLDVFDKDEKLGIYTVAYKDDCWHCGACVLDCPKGAIELILPFGCM